MASGQDCAALAGQSGLQGLVEERVFYVTCLFVLLVSFDETFMNLWFVVLVCLYILDHVPVAETFVLVSCAGCYSTGAASGQYQLRVEEDSSPSTGVSSSRNSY